MINDININAQYRYKCKMAGGGGYILSPRGQGGGGVAQQMAGGWLC